MPFIIGFLSRFISVLFTRSSAFLAAGFTAFIGPAVAAFLKLSSNLGKIALGTAAIGAAVMVFSVAVDLALGGLAALAPDDMVSVGRMFMPSNLNTCISVLVLVRLKSLVFFWVVRLSEKLERS